MKVIVTNEKAGTAQEINTNSPDVKTLLLELKINSQTVLVARNSQILLPTDTLKEGDEILLLSVISGG